MKVRNDLLPEEPYRVHHLLVLCRPDGAEQEHLLDAEGFVEFEETDAFRRRADAERGAALAHLYRRGLARMGTAGEPLVALVVALIIGWHCVRIIIAPHQPRALPLLLKV